ncbi:MAG: TIGR00730 family Rossman fold protein [Actinomycetia bacterium]|nr:TIGR00730 family Rossman fold protein [Actinomycetes bacterium]
MNERRSAEVHALVEALADDVGNSNHRYVVELLNAAVGLVSDHPSRLDLKIASAALTEMRQAFATFAPYHDHKKVTIFGSARTQPDDTAYKAAHDVASGMAERGWMVVTGAGPGIMAAANHGAGRDMSFGVNIRLPFEQEVNALLHGDEKLVEMKYFFTRKLMLMKESAGFIALPGGFGTQDETFELLTLQQTGKGEPAPVVLLDVPGGSYWESWVEFITTELEGGGMINPIDHGLYSLTDDVDQACEEVVSFWRNYHSVRYVGERLVVRMNRPLPDEALEEINDRFGYLVDSGQITPSKALRPEVVDDDVVDLPRIAFDYGRSHYGKLRGLIEVVNRY